METQELIDRCDNFSIAIFVLCRKMENDFVGKILARQLVRSASSMGSNLEEAQGAESKMDFIHKISISYKEARESGYWLRLIKKGKILQEDLLEKAIQEREELSRIFASIIRTSRKKLVKLSK